MRLHRRRIEAMLPMSLGSDAARLNVDGGVDCGVRVAYASAFHGRVEVWMMVGEPEHRRAHEPNIKRSLISGWKAHPG